MEQVRGIDGERKGNRGANGGRGRVVGGRKKGTLIAKEPR